MNDYYINGSWGSAGEAYHIAMHGLLIPSEEVSRFGINPPAGADESNLFEFLDDLQIAYRKGNGCYKKMGLSETANTIFLRWHRDQVSVKRRIIEGLARDNKWQNPFERMLRMNNNRKVIIWQRSEKTKYESWRNSKWSLTLQLIEMLNENDVTPVLIGSRVCVENAISLGDFWNDRFFTSGNCLCKQLWFVNDLFQSHQAIASVGMMSGGMDGAALFFGRKTIFFGRDSDAKPRMAKVASVVPGMHWMSVDYDVDKGLERLQIDKMNELKKLIGL